MATTNRKGSAVGGTQVASELVLPQRLGRLTDIGCPDCRGVLAVAALGDRGGLRFECQVGHAYSEASLAMAKENQVENALWSAAETYQEIDLLYRELAQRARAASAEELGVSYKERAQRAGSFREAVLKLIAQDLPPQPTKGGPP